MRTQCSQLYSGILFRRNAVSTTEVSSPSDILGGDGVSEDVPDTGVAEVRGRELVIIYAITSHTSLPVHMH